MTETRVFVGATSISTAYGHGTDAHWDAMLSGHSALRPMTFRAGADDVPFHGQRLTDVPEEPLGLTRIERMMVRDAHAVLAESGISMADGRTGIIISTTKGDVADCDEARHDAGSTAYLSVLAKRVASALGSDRQPIVVSNACISGVVALIVASRLVRQGTFDNILVIGADEMTDFVASGFIGFRSVSADRCRPYDASHCGLSLGEASGCALVTRHEALSKGIVLLGGAMTDDANHISGPSRTGAPLAEAIKKALSESHLEADEIAFVNAHGTGTVYNDEMEAKAITLAGLGQTPVNSLKPFVGHTLGASGLIEAIVCCEELRRGTILPTLGFERMGGEFPLNVSAQARKTSGRHCIKTASGFGGCNAALVLSTDTERHVDATPQKTWKTVREVEIKNGTISVDGKTVLTMPDSHFAELIREAYHLFSTPNMKFFKMDDMSKLGYVGAEILLNGIDIADPYRTCVMLSNRASSLDTDCTYSDLMKTGEASPAKFVYTLPNIVIGEICIRHKICGETIFTVRETPPDSHADELPMLNTADATNVVTGWCELMGDQYELKMKLLQ